MITLIINNLDIEFHLIALSQKFIAKSNTERICMSCIKIKGGNIFLLLREYLKTLLNLQENVYGKVSCLPKS